MKKYYSYKMVVKILQRDYREVWRDIIENYFWGGRLMFTRRHFIGIARLLGSIEAPAELADSFIEFLKEHNDAFDETKFVQEIDEFWGKDWKSP